MARNIVPQFDPTFQDEPLRFEKGDVVAVSDDAYGEVRLDWTVGIHTGDQFFKPGMRGIVEIVQYDCNPYDDLVYVRFDDGTTDNMLSCWLDLIHRPINDPAMYDGDLFSLAARTDASAQGTGVERE